MKSSSAFGKFHQETSLLCRHLGPQKFLSVAIGYSKLKESREVLIGMNPEVKNCNLYGS